MADKKNILVIAGHLDDAVIAVGGIIRKFANLGCEVSVICWGNGDEAFTDVNHREDSIRKFQSEAYKAYEILGVTDFKCFDIPDFAVQKNRETYRQCIGAIRRTKPDIIMGHYWAEYFQHHDAAKLACDSWWQAGWNCSADLGNPWVAKALYHFEVLHNLPNPTHIVDISDTFEAKMEAWSKFSTAEEHLGTLENQLKFRALYHGSTIGVKYAEVLKRSYFVPDKVTDLLKEL